MSISPILSAAGGGEGGTDPTDEARDVRVGCGTVHSGCSPETALKEETACPRVFKGLDTPGEVIVERDIR